MGPFPSCRACSCQGNRLCQCPGSLGPRRLLSSQHRVCLPPGCSYCRGIWVLGRRLHTGQRGRSPQAPTPGTSTCPAEAEGAEPGQGAGRPVPTTVSRLWARPVCFSSWFRCSYCPAGPIACLLSNSDHRSQLCVTPHPQSRCFLHSDHSQEGHRAAQVATGNSYSWEENLFLLYFFIIFPQINIFQCAFSVHWIHSLGSLWRSYFYYSLLLHAVEKIIIGIRKCIVYVCVQNAHNWELWTLPRTLGFA